MINYDINQKALTTFNMIISSFVKAQTHSWLFWVFLYIYILQYLSIKKWNLYSKVLVYLFAVLSCLESQNGMNRSPCEFSFFPLSWSEVTLAGWAPGRDPSGRQTAGRGTRSCCPSQPTGRLTGPKACQTDTTPGRAGGREGAGEGARQGVYGGGGWHRGQSVPNAFIYFI